MERFTVAHVLREPELRTLAEEYLRQWNGTFEFLAAAQAALNRGDTLPAPVVKGVLNSMQADGRVTNMPTPPDLTFDAGIRSLIGEAGARMQKELDAFQRRPHSIECKTTWKYKYGIALATNARAIHLVDTSVKVEWYWQQDLWVVPLGWVCNPHVYMRTKAKDKTLADYYRLISHRRAGMLLVAGRNAVAVHKELGIAPRDWVRCSQCHIKSDHGFRV